VYLLKDRTQIPISIKKFNTEIKPNIQLLFVFYTLIVLLHILKNEFLVFVHHMVYYSRSPHTSHQNEYLKEN